MICEDCKVEMLDCKELCDSKGNSIFKVKLVKCPKCLHLKVKDPNLRKKLE